MAQIPQHTMKAARFSGVNAPAGAFSASTRAVAGLVKNANGNVDALVQQGFQAQDLRNRETIREKSSDMRNMQVEFMQNMADANVDPSKWVPQWEERLSGFKSQMYQKGDPTDVIGALDTKYKEFSESSILGINGSALKENRRRAKAGYDLDYREAIRDGEYGRAKALVEEYSNILDPVEVKGALMGIEREQKKATLELDRKADPMAFHKEVQDGGYDLSPIQKQKQLDLGEREILQRENMGLKAVDEMFDLEAFDDEDQVNKFLDTFPEISDVNRKLVVKSFQDSTPVPDAERYAISDAMRADKRAYDNDAITFEEYQKRWNRNNSAVLAYGKRSNTGGLRTLSSRTDPMNIDPSAPRKGMSSAYETTDEYIHDAVARRIATQVATNIAGIKIELSGGATIGGVVSDPVEFASRSGKEREYFTAIRRDLENEVLRWASSLSGTPTTLEVDEYIDRVQPKIVARRVNEKYTSTPSDISDEDSAKHLRNVLGGMTGKRFTPPTPVGQQSAAQEVMLLKEAEMYLKPVTDLE